ncbi:MAG: VOC family protein [Sphingobacteriales bacterium]|nr:MAG: VOC family protein [Sphingobacteriales bacterium]
MNNSIYPCLWFDTQAKEAAAFYCSVFKDATICSENPFVSIFSISGKKIMGLNGGPLYSINPSVSLFVLCETVAETNAVWDKLINGGQALMPINKYPWSERYGWVKDKYGMTWQISVVYQQGDKQTLSPSMLFTGKNFGRAEEAIHFYTSIFNNSSVNPLIHYPAGDANAGKVMFAECKLNGYNVIIMDGPGEHAYTFNEGVSLVVDCDTQEEIDYYWNKLTEGGEESMCGWLKDKFGVSWQIVPANLGKWMNDPDKGTKVMQAFMKMKKFDIARLEAVAQ